MKDYRDWFIENAGFMPIEHIQQISRLIQWHERSEEQLKDSIYDASLNAAMLADICEAMFGGLATNAPSLLSYPHAGWTCGPMQKLVNESYVHAFYRLRTKNSLTTEQKQNTEAWEVFISKLKQENV